MEQSQYPQLQLQPQLLAVLQKKQATISAAMDVLNDGFTNGLMDTKSERTHYAHALLVTNLLMDIGPKSGSAEDLAAVPAADIVQLNDYLDNVDFSISMWVNDPKLSEADLLMQLADNVQRHDYSRFSLLGESAYDIAKAKSTELATLIPTIQAQLPAPVVAPAPAPTPAPSVSSPQARVAAPVPDEQEAAPPQSSFQRQPSPIRTRGSDLSNTLAGGIRNIVNAAKITGDFLSRNADNADNVDLDEVNLKISEHLNSPEVQAERDAQAADNFVNSVKNDNDVGHMKKLAEQYSADIDRLHATGKSPVNSKDVFDTLDLMSMLREYNIARDVEYVRDALEKYPRDVVMNSIGSVRDAHYMKDLTENYLNKITDVEARKRQGKIEGAQNLMGALGELGSLANPGNWTKKSDSNQFTDGADDDNDVALAAAAVVNTTAKALKNSDYGVFDYDSPEYDVNTNTNTNTNTTVFFDTTTSDPAPTDEIGAANEEAVTKNLADLHETGTEQIAKAVESGALTPEEGAAKLKELNALMDESAKKNKEAHDRSKTAAERIEAQNELSKAMHQVGAMIGALFNYLLRILTLGKYGTPGAGAPDAGANTNGAATPVGTTPNPNVATPVVAATPAGAANVNVVTSKEGSNTKAAPTEPTPEGDAPDVVTKPQAKVKVLTKNKPRGM